MIVRQKLPYWVPDNNLSRSDSLKLKLDRIISLQHQQQEICGYFSTKKCSGPFISTGYSASLFVTIRSIAHVWHQLNKETAEINTQALVLSKLDYCNSVYHGAPKYTKAKLQRLQNMSARVVSNVKHCNHITPYLSDLH